MKNPQEGDDVWVEWGGVYMSGTVMSCSMSEIGKPVCEVEIDRTGLLLAVLGEVHLDGFEFSRVLAYQDLQEPDSDEEEGEAEYFDQGEKIPLS